MVTSQSRLLRVCGVALEWTLGVALLGLIYMHFAPNVKGVPSPSPSENSVNAAGVGNGAAAGPVCGTATVCLVDDISGDTFTFSCPSGAYTFTRCKDSFTISGTGKAFTASGVEWLQAFQTDRRITADLLLTQGTGRASISFKTGPGMYQNFVINQIIPFGNPFAPCTCSAKPPPSKG